MLGQGRRACWPTRRCSPTPSSRPTASSSCVGDIYDAAPYGYVIAEGPGRLRQGASPSAVKALITDGTYKTILDKWGVEAGAITDPAVNALTGVTGSAGA